MFELLLLAFFSDDSLSTLDKLSQSELVLPRIEILDTEKIPVKSRSKVAPKFLNSEDTAALAFDVATNKVLFQRHASRPQPVASISKLLSFIIIFENHDLDEVVTVPLIATKIAGSKIDIYQHEQLTVRTLLEAILIPSANDAMIALAVYDAGSEIAFVDKMNDKAAELGLKSANFVNATGLDLKDEESDSFYGNEMSALDVLKLTRILLRNDFFKETVAKDHFWGQSVDERFFHEKVSTNPLFTSFINSRGIKTGFTPFAGECFVNLSEDRAGNEIITIVLGSKDRFGETKNLVSWVWDAFVWR